MEKSKIDEAKVGFITFVGLTLLIGFIIFIKGIDITDKTKDIIIIFDNSAGITAGSPVVMQGVSCGSVSDIWNEKGKVKIKVSIDKKCELKEDATAIISILEITGGKKIEISPGSSNIPFNYSKSMQGIAAIDVSSMFTKISQLSEELQPIIRGVDSIVINLNKITNDEKFISGFQDIVYNTSAVTSELVTIISDNKAKISSILNNLDRTIVENEPELKNVINKLNITTNSLNNLLIKVDTTLIYANNLIKNSNDVIMDIKEDNGGMVSKIIYDKQFTEKIDKLVYRLDSLIEQIQKYGININARLGTRP